MSAGAPKMRDLSELAARCRAHGVKATPQRVEIFRALLETREHPSPEAVYRVVKRRMPTVSLATIYKTLEALHAAGLARLVSHSGETKRYDGRLDPHHHLVCRSCGRITDFNHPALKDLALPHPVDDFITDEISVQLLGFCNAACREKQNKQENNNG